MVCGESSYAKDGAEQKRARSTAVMAARTRGEVMMEAADRLAMSSALVRPVQRQAMLVVVVQGREVVEAMVGVDGRSSWDRWGVVASVGLEFVRLVKK